MNDLMNGAIRKGLAHPHSQPAPNEIARLILIFLLLLSRRVCVGTKCCFFDRNICHCDYVNASLSPKPRLQRIVVRRGETFAVLVVQL